jgi:hypothetical protein
MSKILGIRVMREKTFQANQAEAASGGIVIGVLGTLAVAGLYSAAKKLATMAVRALAEETPEVANANVEAPVANDAPEAPVVAEAPTAPVTSEAPVANEVQEAKPAKKATKKAAAKAPAEQAA